VAFHISFFFFFLVFFLGTQGRSVPPNYPPGTREHHHLQDSHHRASISKGHGWVATKLGKDPARTHAHWRGFERSSQASRSKPGSDQKTTSSRARTAQIWSSVPTRHPDPAGLPNPVIPSFVAGWRERELKRKKKIRCGISTLGCREMLEHLLVFSWNGIDAIF